MMILISNVCDHCGNQSEIKKGDNQIEFQFKWMSLASSKLENSYNGNKLTHVTFCGKDCLIEYMKDVFSNTNKKEE
jgi:hypothetical protein